VKMEFYCGAEQQQSTNQEHRLQLPGPLDYKPPSDNHTQDIESAQCCFPQCGVFRRIAHSWGSEWFLSVSSYRPCL
jgi:hypothetical protein